jgi:nanoRNase/pAp phosphatase (c-di-AMP/oligoRNAs hydrolase)
MGGGGHAYAAGAFVQRPYGPLKEQVVNELSQLLDQLPSQK